MTDIPAYPPPPDEPPAGYAPPPTELQPAAGPAHAAPAPTAPAPPTPAPITYPSPAGYPPPTPPSTSLARPLPIEAYPSPLYRAPAYGYAAPPPARRLSRPAWLAIIAGIVALVLVLAAAAYGIGGYLFAANRISSAADTINAANAHRGSINGSFDTMSQRITSFDSGDGTANKTSSAQIVSESQSMTSTIAADSLALRRARVKLDDLSWLTALSRGSLQDQASRIDHARKALAIVKSASEDYAHLGQFLQVFFQVEIDLVALDTALGKNDLTGAQNAFASLRSDTPNALQLVNVSGLPTQFHDFLVAMQAYVADIRQESIANNAGDQKALAAAEKQALADFNKAVAVDFGGTSGAIRAHYQRYRDDYNSELDQATA